jgi:hypothetical protein
VSRRAGIRRAVRRAAAFGGAARLGAASGGGPGDGIVFDPAAGRPARADEAGKVRADEADEPPTAQKAKRTR